MDKAHIHSHIVFNSVNAVTGKMYHSTCENYYRQIRGVSDRLCKAHGLSIVLENGEKKTVSYAEWLRQKKSQLTFRSMLEADLRDAIKDANDLGHFFLLMEHKEMIHDKTVQPTSARVYLKTPNAPGRRAFSRCAAPFFLEIRQYSCKKMSCSAQKFLAAGHIESFQIHPRWRFQQHPESGRHFAKNERSMNR